MLVRAHCSVANVSNVLSENIVMLKRFVLRFYSRQIKNYNGIILAENTTGALVEAEDGGIAFLESAIAWCIVMLHFKLLFNTFTKKQNKASIKSVIIW